MLKVFSIDKNPLCSDIERLNCAISKIPKDEALVLSLARHTNVNFFAQTWVAQLIAHLVRRQGDLIIRDAHSNWSPLPFDRFTANIDGVAALVLSRRFSNVRLENIKHQTVPLTLYEKLISNLEVTSQLEDKGQTRTFIAVDPNYPTPIEFSSSLNTGKKFQYIIQDIFRSFNYKLGQDSVKQRKVKNDLHNFIYEVFQNTIEHGRFSKMGKIIPGLRYLRIRTYIDKVDMLRRRAEGFLELENFISRISDSRKTLRLMELTVSDGGQGIVSHYLNSESKAVKEYRDREALLHQLIGGKKSSKDHLSGVGLGLPNAMDALSKLHAFVSLRTEEFWMCRDFNETYEINHAKILQPVTCQVPISRLRGTQFNVVICISS